MLTDIEIAQQTKLRPIAEIAEELHICPEELEPYGRFKAKLNDDLFKRLENEPDGKLILVTAINPTPAGEGKTTTTAGLGQAMAKIGKKAVIALREPSLGPVFGIKGGAAGGKTTPPIFFPEKENGRRPSKRKAFPIASEQLEELQCLPIALPCARRCRGWRCYTI